MQPADSDPRVHRLQRLHDGDGCSKFPLSISSVGQLPGGLCLLNSRIDVFQFRLCLRQFVLRTGPGGIQRLLGRLAGRKRIDRLLLTLLVVVIGPCPV